MFAHMSDESKASDDSWLTRLSSTEWLSAAKGELARASVALTHKQQRAGVTQARRAAGMAWNAVLREIVDVKERARYGRSYMDHLKTLSAEASVSASVREAALALLSAPPGSILVQLGAGDTRFAQAAGVIVGEAERRVAGQGVS